MGKLSSTSKQFLSIILCNLLTVSYGLSVGWATINYNDLMDENSSFPTGPLNMDQASRVVSLVFIGAFLGNFAILPIGQIFGLKRTIHTLCIPILLSIILTIYSYNIYYLYIARVLCGFVSGALAIGIPTLVNDISHDSVRGALNSIFDPSYNFGIIVSFFLGNYLSCLDQAKVQLIIPIVFMILMFLIPESPEYWSDQNKKKRQMKAIKFYKGSIAALESAEFIEKSPNPKLSKVEEGKQEKKYDEDDLDSNISFSDFCTKQARRSCFIAFSMYILCLASGSLTILSYVTDIFTKTGSSLSPKNASLLVSITQITGNLVLLNIVERFNRKTLYIWSALLTAASYFLFGTYCLLWFKQPEFEWMPPFCFACIIYFSCMGLLPIPYILTIEIFPKKIRKPCLAVSISMLWLLLFILGLIFPTVLEAIGLFTCMITLGFFCLLSAVFGIFFMPETRGKSYEEIMDILNK